MRYVKSCFGTLALALALIALPACGGGGELPVDDSPAAMVFALQPVDTVINNVFNVSLVFLDDEGNVKPTSDIPVTISLENNAGGGALLGTTSTTTEFGVAYFFYSLKINAEGEGYTLRAESGDFVAISDPFDILPVQVASIAFVSQPPSVPLYQGFGCTVELRDQTGAVLPRDGLDVTVELAANPGASTLSGTTTVQTVAGVATFSGLQLENIASGYILRASHETFTALSQPFAVGPPPVNSIRFVDQPPAVLGTDEGFGVSVELLDIMGLRIPVDGTNVQVAILANPGGSTLSGTTSSPSVQGLCTFLGLSLNRPGEDYTLRATQNTFTDDSDPFDVVRVFVPPTWVDPSGHVDITTSDDGQTTESFGFSGGAQFPFYGSNYGQCFVNGNGNITFTSGDGDFSESVSEMANSSFGARICGWWHDLSPQNGNMYRQNFSDRTIISYVNVDAEFLNSSLKANFQITMWDWGRIDIVYGDMTTASNGAIIGISPGDGSLSGSSTDFTSTVYPNWTSVTGGFPYEQFFGTPDLTNTWISFIPLGPSENGNDGYEISSGT